MTRITTVIAALVFFANPGFGSQARSSQWSRFDGHWWTEQSADEHMAFIVGFYSCYTWDLKKTLRLTWKTYQLDSMVNRYLERDTARVALPLWKVLPRIFRAAGPSPWENERGAEPDPKGRYFEQDGAFWGEYTSEEVAGTMGKGYVEGYLVCNEFLLHGRRGRYSRSPAEYVALIKGWYGWDKTHREYRVPGGGDVPVPDVLFKFRDSVR